MKRNSIITKSICYQFLVVMLYMHVCSALCATSSQGCCGKEQNANNHCKNECCKQEKKSEGKAHDCQDMHLSFFSTTGQFSQLNADISFKPIQPLIAEDTPLFIIEPSVTGEYIFACNGFHPPPPKADIRVFISSFQI